MCDIGGMKTIRQYIDSAKPQLTHEEWAARFGISRSYFTDIVNGKVRPGTKVMEAISNATGGKVPPAVWFRKHGGAS